MKLSGSICKIVGLKSRSDLNGHTALVLSYDADEQRYAVEDTASGERVRVKETNLVLQDPVLKLHQPGGKTSLGGMELCHEYIPRLFKLAYDHSAERAAVGTMAMQGWPAQGLFSVIEGGSEQHRLFILNLAAVGHFCALEVSECV